MSFSMVVTVVSNSEFSFGSSLIRQQTRKKYKHVLFLTSDTEGLRKVDY